MGNLLIIGAGQYGMVAKEIAEATGKYTRISFLDDSNPMAIGKMQDFEKFRGEYTHAIVAIGDSELRLDMIERLERSGYKIPILMHPKAYVSPSANIGVGSFIEPMAVIHTETVIGRGCIISAGTIVNHNAVVGDVCHLNCGTIVKARAVIAEKTRTDYGQIIG